MTQIKIYLYDKENLLLANADVTFEDIDFGPITVKGFQIWKSQFQNKRLDGEKINIEPPSTRENPNVAKCQFIHLDNAEKWFDLMIQIYAAYKKEVDDKEKIIKNNFSSNPFSNSFN